MANIYTLKHTIHDTRLNDANVGLPLPSLHHTFLLLQIALVKGAERIVSLFFICFNFGRERLEEESTLHLLEICSLMLLEVAPSLMLIPASFNYWHLWLWHDKSTVHLGEGSSICRKIEGE